LRKNEIKAGVIYAYNENRRPWRYSAVMILDVVTLYHNRRYKPNGLEQAHPSTRPSRGAHYGQSATGYLAVHGPADELAQVDPEKVYAEFLETGRHPEGYESLTLYSGGSTPSMPAGTQIRLLTSLAYLHGGYHEKVTELAELEKARVKALQEKAREAQERERRWADVLSALHDAGLASARTDVHNWHIQVNLDDAERLVKQLRGEATT
jgi:hypothetical protein